MKFSSIKVDSETLFTKICQFNHTINDPIKSKYRVYEINHSIQNSGELLAEYLVKYQSTRKNIIFDTELIKEFKSNSQKSKFYTKMIKENNCIYFLNDERFIYLNSFEEQNSKCPLSLEKIKNAVVDIHGHYYEKENLEKWMSNRGSCPISNLAMDKSHYTETMHFIQRRESFEKNENAIQKFRSTVSNFSIFTEGNIIKTRKKIENIINLNKDQIYQISFAIEKSKTFLSFFMFLGDTGVGKSTSINYYLNKTPKEIFLDDNIGKSSNSYIDFDDPIAPVGHKDSCTTVPSIYYGEFKDLQAYTSFVDFPGLGDTRGFEQDISCVLGVRYMIEEIRNKSDVRIVFVIDGMNFNQRMNFSNLYKWLCKAFGADFHLKFADNFGFLITKVYKRQMKKILELRTKYNQLSEENKIMMDLMIPEGREPRIFICDPLDDSDAKEDFKFFQKIQPLQKDFNFGPFILDSTLNEAHCHIKTLKYELKKEAEAILQKVVTNKNLQELKVCLKLMKSLIDIVELLNENEHIMEWEKIFRNIVSQLKESYPNLEHLKEVSELYQDARFLDTLIMFDDRTEGNVLKTGIVNKIDHILNFILIEIVKCVQTICTNIFDQLNQKIKKCDLKTLEHIRDSKDFSIAHQKVQSSPLFENFTELVQLVLYVENTISEFEKSKSISCHIKENMISFQNNSSDARMKSFVSFQKNCEIELMRLKNEKELKDSQLKEEELKIRQKNYENELKKMNEVVLRAREEAKIAAEKEINDSKSNYNISTIIYLLKELAIYGARFIKNPEILKYLTVTIANPQALKLLAQRVGIELAENSLKSVPLLSAVIGIGLCFRRLWNKEYGRAVAELGLGVVGCFPGPGTVASILGSIALIITDIYYEKKK